MFGIKNVTIFSFNLYVYFSFSTSDKFSFITFSNVDNKISKFASLFKLINYERKKGLIGIACVPKLYSGGLKAIRLGYIPQCMPLDFSGCKAHWQERDIMTTINFKVFEEKF